MQQVKKGPLSYENWKSALAGMPWQIAYEYPLFTDAHIEGQVRDGLGPYEILNTVLTTYSQRPALVLRAYSHVNSILPRMDRTDEERYHGGYQSDEIAALVSLCLGVRVEAGCESRIFVNGDDRRGIPTAGHFQDPALPKVSDRPILRSALGPHSLMPISRLTSLPNLDPEDAIVLVRVARMYQKAIWIVESTPELTWIMLASAVETAAQQWRTTNETPLEMMRTSRPNLELILRRYGNDELLSQVADEIAPYMGATKKFVDFLIEYLPPPPPERPSQYAQHPWEPKPMKKTLRRIYDCRSRALHGGVPFPAPMCEPPSLIDISGLPEEIPLGFATSMKGGTWVAEDIPMRLHTFEYIVRNALLNWWNSLLSVSDMDTQ